MITLSYRELLKLQNCRNSETVENDPNPTPHHYTLANFVSQFQLAEAPSTLKARNLKKIVSYPSPFPAVTLERICIASVKTTGAKDDVRSWAALISRPVVTKC